MAQFRIEQRSDGQVVGWGDVDADDATVTVEGMGLVVTRESLDEIAAAPSHTVVWPDGPPGS